jgi:glycosyltransferase involved in cell wall biosynthesis
MKPETTTASPAMPTPAPIDAASAPLITIGMTSYCASGTIARAIGSALAQDWPNLELIIADDCSPDDSPRVIEAAIAGAPNARLIRREINGGPAAARNTVLASARGAFVAFFDDDDESMPGRLRVQHARLVEHEACSGAPLVACYASGNRRYPNGYTMPIDAIGSRSSVLVGEAVADYLLFNGRHDGLFYGGGTPTCALMARRETFEAVGGFDEHLRRIEDVDFAVRLARAGGHFVGCAETLYLQHATEGLDKTPLMNLKAELQLVDKHADYLRAKHRHAYARDWFKIRFYHFTRQRLAFLLALAWLLARFPLTGTRHLVRSAPGRLRHENKMSKASS